jgi:hypothetical protein
VPREAGTLDFLGKEAGHCESIKVPLAVAKVSRCYMSGKQIMCPRGTHGSIDWIKDAESLVHAPFAWIVQQLHSNSAAGSDVSISFLLTSRRSVT